MQTYSPSYQYPTNYIKKIQCYEESSSFPYSNTYNVNDLVNRIQILEKELYSLSGRFNLLSQYLYLDTSYEPRIIISGANVYITNSNNNNNNVLNGVGNLILGSNECRKTTNINKDRIGSHNIIIGDYNHYSGCNSIIIGNKNTLHGSFALINGFRNTTYNNYTSIISGCFNKLTGITCCVFGKWGKQIHKINTKQIKS